MCCNNITLLFAQDLEDVRMMMAALDEVREATIEMDMELSPIEECYAFLQRCGVSVAREEMERVDSLRYSFKKLLSQAVSKLTIGNIMYNVTRYCTSYVFRTKYRMN